MEQFLLLLKEMAAGAEGSGASGTPGSGGVPGGGQAPPQISGSFNGIGNPFDAGGTAMWAPQAPVGTGGQPGVPQGSQPGVPPGDAAAISLLDRFGGMGNGGTQPTRPQDPNGMPQDLAQMAGGPQDLGQMARGVPYNGGQPVNSLDAFLSRFGRR